MSLLMYAFAHFSEFAQLLVNVSIISRDVALLYTRIGPMQGENIEYSGYSIKPTLSSSLLITNI